MTFFDRRDELDALGTALASDEPELVVVYGRRRVGKTALITEFCAKHDHIYYLAAQEAEARQRTKFVERIAAYRDERVPDIDDWEDALAYLAETLTEAPGLIVAIDEFPYLVDENQSIPSYLQGFLDREIAETRSLIILCGSSVSVMESEVLGHESPLYGRRTAQLDLRPFTFAQASEIITYPIRERIRSFSVTGGTPMYLTRFDYDRSLRGNILAEILSPSALMYNEPEFLLRTELRNPARYMSILESVALGKGTANEIAGATGIDQGPLSKYLRTLRRLRLLDRDVPVTASAKQSKRSRYRVGDEFLRFWFRFVEPNRSSIEAAPTMVYDETIEPRLPDHVATTFEDICREALWTAVRRGELPPYGDIGRWWYGEDEIDIVGLAPGDDRILFGECKWTTEPVGRGVATRLETVASEVRWGPSDREERFVLFSKSGFTDQLQSALDERWKLFDMADLEAFFDRARPDVAL